MAYKTPGVYVEEISTLPPSVAEVATAIPAFIGYTEKAQDEKGAPLTGVVVRRITSMLEYEQFFGAEHQAGFTVTVDGPKTAISDPDSKFILYYALKFFYDNGGGPCYIVSAGRYNNVDFNADELKKGLDAIALVDEPTLLLFPDAVNLPSMEAYCSVANAALDQCQKLKDRFTILDVRKEEVQSFRNTVRSETEYLKFGAAYTPHLNTLIAYKFLEKNVTVTDNTPADPGKAPKVYSTELATDLDKNKLKVSYTGPAEKPEVMIIQDQNLTGAVTFQVFEDGVLWIKIKENPTPVKTILEAWKTEPKGGFSLEPIEPGIDIIAGTPNNLAEVHKYRVILSTSDAAPVPVLQVDRESTQTTAPSVEIKKEGTVIEITPSSSDNKLTVKIPGDSAPRGDIIKAFNDIPEARKAGFTLAPSGTGNSVPVTAATSFLEVKAHMVEMEGTNPVGAASTLKMKVTYTGTATSPTVKVTEKSSSGSTGITFDTTTDGVLDIQLPFNPKAVAGATAKAIAEAWRDQGGFHLEAPETTPDQLIITSNARKSFLGPTGDPILCVIYTGTGTPTPVTVTVSTDPTVTAPGFAPGAEPTPAPNILLPNGNTGGVSTSDIANVTTSGSFAIVKVKDGTITDGMEGTAFQAITPDTDLAPDPTVPKTYLATFEKATTPSRHYLEVRYVGAAPASGSNHSVEILGDSTQSAPILFDLKKDASNNPIPGALLINLKKTATDPVSASSAAVLAAWENQPDKFGFQLRYLTAGLYVGNAPNTALAASSAPPSVTGVSNKPMNELDKGTPLYNQVRQAMGQKLLTLPPSPAMAGVYARVDRTSGVWKAPANVSVLGVSGPKQRITHEEQEDLNVDPVAGKSINAIRPFTGKGILVWGGRTLAGNDNEWRYISVRRLFNLIEESVQKATSFAVFEANDTSTWLKVKAMIDSYLYGLWQQGALAGPTPAQAFFVNVGLGKTMTTQDILEGRMIVEIGIAAVRPAEFIILRFSHKLQEA